MKLASLDSLNLNAVADSEIPFKLQVKRADGTLTPLILHVIGQYSDPVEKWNADFFRKYQRELSLAKRQGKEPEGKSYEELKAQDIEGTLVRVVGWEGITDAFDKEVLRGLLSANPHLRKDIQEASEDAANFTRTA